MKRHGLCQLNYVEIRKSRNENTKTDVCRRIAIYSREVACYVGVAMCQVNQKSTAWVKKLLTFEVEGKRLRGRPRNTWMAFINNDLKRLEYKQ